MRLHQTNIVTIKQNGDVALSSGGWRTHQTLKGINLSLKSFVPNLQVIADGHVADGAWRWRWSGGFIHPAIQPVDAC